MDNLLINEQNELTGVHLSHARRDSLLVATQAYLNKGTYTFLLVAPSQPYPPLNVKSAYWLLISFDEKLIDLWYHKDQQVFAIGRCVIESEYVRILAMVELASPVEVTSFCDNTEVKHSKLPLIRENLETWFK